MNTVETLTGVTTYKADPHHSQVGFKVRHLGFSKVTGRFEDFDVEIAVNPEDLSTLSASGAIKTASIDTGSNDRDKHLQSADFFESQVYPSMNFHGTEVVRVEGNTFELAGDLTIRDITRRVVLKGEFLGEAKDPWGNERVGFEARTTIDRKEFNLTWNQVLETGGFLVGDSVEITLEIQAIQQNSSN